jgi:hypothetical protein
LFNKNELFNDPTIQHNARYPATLAASLTQTASVPPPVIVAGPDKQAASIIRRTSR